MKWGLPLSFLLQELLRVTGGDRTRDLLSRATTLSHWFAVVRDAPTIRMNKLDPRYSSPCMFAYVRVGCRQTVVKMTECVQPGGGVLPR